jgi:hypothetical protein
MYCPACDEILPAGMASCPDCGGELTRRAPGDDEYERALVSYAKAKRFFLIWMGVVVFAALLMVLVHAHPAWIAGTVLLVGNSVFLFIAAAHFGKSKGYATYVGPLLLIFGFFGGIALFMLPNKFRNR